MEIELIDARDNAEEVVCRAARGDYRPDGVFPHEYSFEEIMDTVDVKKGHEAESVLEAKKRSLIDELMDSDHWGPFEHPEATVHMKGVTRVLMAQLTRHRHLTFDVMSLRYVDLSEEFPREQTPWSRKEISNRFQFPEFRGEDFDVDREGVHEIENPNHVEDIYAMAYTQAIEAYQSLLGMDVPKEQARKVLPMGTKVNMTVTGNARAWMHALAVRTKADVQGETRRAAERVLEELEEWMPYTFPKFREMQPIRVSP